MLPCMYGDSGQALRSCSEEGIWENANLDECSTLTSTLFLRIESVSIFSLYSIELEQSSLLVSDGTSNTFRFILLTMQVEITPDNVEQTTENLRDIIEGAESEDQTEDNLEVVANILTAIATLSRSNPDFNITEEVRSQLCIGNSFCYLHACIHNFCSLCRLLETLLRL